MKRLKDVLTVIGGVLVFVIAVIWGILEAIIALLIFLPIELVRRLVLWIADRVRSLFN